MIVVPNREYDTLIQIDSRLLVRAPCSSLASIIIRMHPKTHTTSGFKQVKRTKFGMAQHSKTAAQDISTWHIAKRIALL